MALTQESILSFLLEHGGKVKNSELLNNFRSHINCSDPAEKQHNRDLFKKLVNSVAVVKQIDEVKFVVVKKRYQDFVKEEAHDASQKTQMEDTFPSPNTSFSSTSDRAESLRMIYSDIENNNMSYSLNMNVKYTDAKHFPERSVENMRALSHNTSADTTTVKVLNISGDQASRGGKSGAVFAVIAVKSPPRDSAPPAAQGVSHAQHKTSDKVVKLPAEVSAQSVPTLNYNLAVCRDVLLSGTQCRKTRQTEDVQLPGLTQLRPQNKTTRHADDAKCSECVPLEPLAHEWLVECAAGRWGQVYALLLQDTRLAQKRDFMSGFTALHWAAKDGNSQMMHKLIEISRKRGTYMNINSKAHGGYTPLHIAAIHGHTEVMVLLVQGYGANINERDNDGKKALHYVGNEVSAEIRALLGGLQQIKYRGKAGDEEYREQSRGFNTISRLFQPHMGKKN
ncbi:ankyrin repeat domain-containing protein SOWAHA [Mastacembelus armatus]|uniref:ankyrin repeat domain-containing protein SOWAHA n=1 Tax=Mastacembelus armatus TaxID=205130 RepID=UPI000E46289F|nr:ankyrin repeat domain-containing protein SOWAHA-like [Mastacembelus armatus]